MFVERHVRRAPRGGRNGAHEFCAGGVAVGVHDPSSRVRGLAAHRERSVRRAVELRAERDDPLDRGGRLARELAREPRVDETRACGDRVARVQLRRVVITQRRGHAPLGPRRRGFDADRRPG